MSDFISSGWSWYVVGIVVFGLVYCAFVLIGAAKHKIVYDAQGNVDKTTGHIWDEDLRELNNPLPRWWLFLFIFTLVFAVGYLVLYPGLGNNKGTLNNYLSTTRLTPFARWSTYWQSNDKFSHNGDVGIRFTVPIYNENPRKRKALETQKEIIMNSRSTDVKEIRQSVNILLKKIENLNQAIATEAYHIQQTGKYIDMRRFAYKNQKNGYNYLMRMEEYTGLLESMERMYKLMLNRGLAIINIEKAVSIYNNNNIFNEIEL